MLNIYTITNYAPRAVSRGVADIGLISDLRKREDRSALRFAANQWPRRDLEQLDAPLAFDVGVPVVSGPDALSPRERDVLHLARLLRPFVRTHCVLAPLGLGNHVNHLAVKRAAMLCVAPKRLAFYEDLPYATWATDKEFRQRLEESNRTRTVSLRPVLVRSSKAVRWKRQAAKRYQTQISDSDAANIADYARHYGAGERLWVPRHSAHWNLL